jgi:hypothetical protein
MLVQLDFKEVNPARLPAEEVEGLRQTAANNSSHSTEGQQAGQVCLINAQAAESLLLLVLMLCVADLLPSDQQLLVQPPQEHCEYGCDGRPQRPGPTAQLQLQLLSQANPSNICSSSCWWWCC